MKSRGLSLVEVLIAATILFAALAIFSDGYRSSLLAGQRAATAAELLTPMPVILGSIKADLFEKMTDELDGAGMVFGVSYTYSAKSVMFAAPPAGYDFSSETARVYEPRYRLYEVSLSLRRGSATRSFSYRELAWSQEVR